MSEDGWTGSIFVLWKMHPFIIFLLFGLMMMGNHVLLQPMALHEKAFLLGLAVFFILVAIIFEVCRIYGEEEQKERAIRRRLVS